MEKAEPHPITHFGLELTMVVIVVPFPMLLSLSDKFPRGKHLDHVLGNPLPSFEQPLWCVVTEVAGAGRTPPRRE